MSLQTDNERGRENSRDPRREPAATGITSSKVPAEKLTLRVALFVDVVDDVSSDIFKAL